jgi:hypothetical protein
LKKAAQLGLKNSCAAHLPGRQVVYQRMEPEGPLVSPLHGVGQFIQGGAFLFLEEIKQLNKSSAFLLLSTDL